MLSELALSQRLLDRVVDEANDVPRENFAFLISRRLVLSDILAVQFSFVR